MSTKQTPTKLLMIVDDPTSVESLITALKQHKFQIRSTNSCVEGRQLTKTFDPDVILVDLWSPNDGGVELCKEIRSFSAAPILILTSSSKPGHVEKMLDAGADECLIKPAPQNILVAHIKTLSRRYQVELEAKQAMKTTCDEDPNNLIVSH